MSLISVARRSFMIAKKGDFRSLLFHTCLRQKRNFDTLMP